MKKILAGIAVLVAGLIAYNYATTGAFSLIPSTSRSDEERQVHELQQRFAAANKQYAQAYRAAAVGGLDTTADADEAIGEVKLIKRELAAIGKKLTEERAKTAARKLSLAVEEFLSKT